MSRGARVLVLITAALAVATFVAASIATFHPHGATIGSRAADAMRRALLTLNDDTLASNDRLTAYRERLLESQRLLIRTLRANPTNTSAIERLAVVRWELGVLQGTPDSTSASALAAIAAGRAPRVPDVQFGLGELFLRMGLIDDAVKFLGVAVELSPQKTNQVVKSMLDAGMDPATIARDLPHSVELVVALKEPFERSGDASEWLTAAETLLPKHPTELIWLYAEFCFARNSTNRLLDHAQSLGVLPDPEAEARRQVVIGRAEVLVGDQNGAASAAAKARALAPLDTSVLTYAGQIALAVGRGSDAEACFREALHTLAVSRDRTMERARLYRQHGQALESIGRIDEAFDAYRRAQELWPDDPWLKQRFAISSPTVTQ
jgi:tetratricopeptide (TPR) repeat protein